MYMSNFNLIRKIILLIFIVGILLLLVYLYSSDKSYKASLNSDICERMLKEEEARFAKAVEEVRRHNKQSLITIFGIASGSKSEYCSFAELSETANSVLVETLLADAIFWIKSLSGVDYENMKGFIKNGGLALINDDEYIKSKKILLINLKKYKGTQKEIRLKNLLIAKLQKNG